MLNRLLSLFLKPNCPLCQRSADDVFCQYCLAKLSYCRLKNHQQLIDSDFFVFAWGKYDRDLKRAIASLKYDNQENIGEIFGIWLGKTWLKLGKKKQYPQLTIVPIPLHPHKKQLRGYNQAELIARGFCHITNYSCKTNLLLRNKDTEAMFGLNPQQRKQNIRNAFKIGADMTKLSKNQQILIVDDIYTTGTTAIEARSVLNKARLKTIGIATVSRVDGEG